jgi:hypothetical protein
MRFWAIVTACLSLLGGAVDPDGDPEARSQGQTGYSAEGDGFYVWDEDRESAAEWASQLAESAQKRQSS